MEGGNVLKIKLAVSNERYLDLKATLESYGIEIDDTADLILCENNSFVDNLIVRDKTTGEKIVLPVEDIVFIETYGHSVEVHSIKGIYQSSDRLYKIYSLLNPNNFLRISNSVIIAKNKVMKITPTLSMKFILTMTNGKKVDVTRNYYYIFKESFNI